MEEGTREGEGYGGHRRRRRRGWKRERKDEFWRHGRESRRKAGLD